MSTPIVYKGIDVISNLGCGFSADVQLVRRNGQMLALKVFKAEQQTFYQNEKEIMQLLIDVPGVIHFRETDLDCSGCIMMEYARRGNMLQYLQQGKMSEGTARVYFRQMVEIIGNIHKMGIAHRDLKLENMLLNEDFELLVCDFGFAVKFLDNQGRRIKVNNFMGTPENVAPELFLQQPYNPVEADLFQLGVVLFQICAGFSPFRSANVKNDPIYQLIYKKQITKFWECHNQAQFTPALKDIIIKLLAFNPNQRLSISEIDTHPWMKQILSENQNVNAEMQKRWDLINEIKIQTHAP